jgi:hypothetical protein
MRSTSTVNKTLMLFGTRRVMQNTKVQRTRIETLVRTPVRIAHFLCCCETLRFHVSSQTVWRPGSRSTWSFSDFRPPSLRFWVRIPLTARMRCPLEIEKALRWTDTPFMNSYSPVYVLSKCWLVAWLVGNHLLLRDFWLYGKKRMTMCVCYFRFSRRSLWVIY